MVKHKKNVIKKDLRKFDGDVILFFKDVLAKAMQDREFCIKLAQTNMKPVHMPTKFMTWLYENLKKFIDNPKYGSKLPILRVYKDIIQNDQKIDLKLKVPYYGKLKDLYNRDVKNEEYALETIQKKVQYQEFKILLEKTINKMGKYQDPEIAIKTLVSESFTLSKDNGVEIIDLYDTYEERQKMRLEIKKNPKKYKRYKFNMPSIDKCLPGGLVAPVVAAITAKTGRGKSVYTIGTGVNASEQNFNVTHITSENKNVQTTGRYDSNITNLKYDDIQLANLSDDEKKLFTKKFKYLKKNRKAKIKIVKLPPNDFTAASILHILNILESQGHKTEFLIIDSPDLMQSVQLQNTKDERLKHKAIYWEIGVLTESKNLITFVTSQLNKVSKDEDPTAEDLSESYDKARMLDFLLVLTQSKTQAALNEASLSIVKNRDGRTLATPILVETALQTMRFIEKPQEDEDNVKGDTKKLKIKKPDDKMKGLRTIGVKTKKFKLKKMKGVMSVRDAKKKIKAA